MKHGVVIVLMNMTRKTLKHQIDEKTIALTAEKTTASETSEPNESGIETDSIRFRGRECITERTEAEKTKLLPHL